MGRAGIKDQQLENPDKTVYEPALHFRNESMKHNQENKSAQEIHLYKTWTNYHRLNIHILLLNTCKQLVKKKECGTEGMND